MHSLFGLQASGRSPKIAVLDTIHGAKVIASRMKACGLESEAFEVYHHLPDLDEFDLIVAPVHLFPGNPSMIQARKLQKPIITHHQAVGEIIAHTTTLDFDIFEITGTHSKTSTALILARMLSNKKKVISHTTQGLEIWNNGSCKTLQKGLSITPANVLSAIDAAISNGAQALVCEVSLGGTGLADYAILSSFSGDYLIANGMKWDSTAKLQMLSLAKEGAKLVANSDTNLSADLQFGPYREVSIEPNEIHAGENIIPLSFGQDLDFESYKTALTAAFAAAYAAGFDLQEVSKTLEGFDGIPGRMMVTNISGHIVCDNSNSGLKIKDIERAFNRYLEDSISVVIGEDACTVCEGLDIVGLIKILRQHRNEIGVLILVGERLKPFAKEMNALTATNRETGLKMALNGEVKKILSCVKSFR